MVVRRIVPLLLFPIALFCTVTACAGPGPRMFPVTPNQDVAKPDGTAQRQYDTDHDGRINYEERLSSDGRVTQLRFDLNHDGEFELEVDRTKPGDSDRHLLILIDSVPFHLVRELWEQGRFRLFHPPCRTISPYPVMTDLSCSEFFGISPCRAVEAEFYDGLRIRGGYNDYLHEANAAWLARTDYHMINLAHSVAYFYPDAWLDHELHYVQKYFLRSNRSPFIGYCVCGSGLGARMGRNGHIAGLVRVDRMCQQIMYETRGRVQITLMSDHGHNLMPSRRVPLSEYLARCGYRVGERLERPGDVVVPEFGVVTCASVYTHEAPRVAADLTMLEGVRQVMYLDANDEVVVLTRDGRARIGRHGDGLRYTAERGDPFKLLPIVEDLSRHGKVDAQGFIPDGEWFTATARHEFPDVLHRVWRAFHGLVLNQPEVMLTVEDGWHCGSKLMSAIYDVHAAHGNLGQLSSYGFVMSTAGRLPPIMRMENLRGELIKAGVPLEEAALGCERVNHLETKK